MPRLDSISRQLIRLALDEDLAGPGDVTSAILPADLQGAAEILAKEDLVLSGTGAFDFVFDQINPSIRIQWTTENGQAVSAGTVLGTVHGTMQDILIAERTALNLIQRLCGIASMSRRAAQALGDSKTQVVDTRKTTPGMRALEKQAVRDGGAKNHRHSLFDGVLIKDNHVDALGGVTAAVSRAKETRHHLLKIECEVRSLQELEEALTAGAEVVLLDNMDNELLAKAVQQTAGRAMLEASGGVNVERLPSMANLGLDYISMGALTHSAGSKDISLNWVAA